MTLPSPRHGATLLSHWGLIHAQGKDAAGFLHGQLTSDVALLGLDRARLAGYCSAKGRLLASFVVWKTSPDDVWLACHASVLAATLKRLSMFVLRAQCRLGDATAAMPLWGLAGDAAQAAWRRAGDGAEPAVWATLPLDGGLLIRLPDAQETPRALRAGPDAAEALVAPPLALDAWRWLDLLSAVPVIEAATADQFVPQMLNFELIGGVDFQKGCYPGQEVVARSQYRGTTKRRAFLFDVEAPTAAGQEVFHSEDPHQPAGLIANAAPTPDGASSALVEVKLAALESGSLHLGTPDGPVLRRREMPYAVPVVESAAG